MEEQIVQDRIDLEELLHVLLKRWWAIVLFIVLGALTAGGLTHYFTVPKYSATSMLYVLGKSTTISTFDLTLGTQLTKDFGVIATSRPVIESACEEIEEKTGKACSYGQLKDMISVTIPDSSRILQITAVSPDPELAQEAANAMSRQIAIQMADIMSMDKPTTVEKAVLPQYDMGNNMRSNCIKGGMLGAFLIIMVVALGYLRDDTIKTEEDVQKYLGLTTLISMPLEKGEKSGKVRKQSSSQRKRR